nr:hypothetical protein BgiMline_006774 [Biomphalaria glabrata]
MFLFSSFEGGSKVYGSHSSHMPKADPDDADGKYQRATWSQKIQIGDNNQHRDAILLHVYKTGPSIGQRTPSLHTIFGSMDSESSYNTDGEGCWN